MVIVAESLLMRRILLFLLLFSGTLSAQTVQIIDNVSESPVPFVRIAPFPGEAFLSDIDGYFVIPAGTERIEFRSPEHMDTTIEVTQIGTQIRLQAVPNELDVFVLLPGVNPAERIMEQAIANRKRNHPMGDQSFTYNSYSKFVFTMNPDAVAQISDTTTDTNLVEIKNLFGKQHLFMMESTTKKSFEPPFREKEVITAYKVSGFSDPAFSTFANELQSFNFYENQFNLLGKSYINPLAFGSIRRYLFILEDTTFSGADTTYTIRFQPRKDKNFDGMKGWLFINTNGFALEKVIAEPAEISESIQPKIIQEYVLVGGTKWFPAKLSTEAIFPALRLNSALKEGYLVGKGSTYIEDIVLGADVSKQRFNAVTVETAIDANEKDSTHWEGTRKYQLTEKEKTTYKVVDSISEAEHFDQKLQLLSALADGKIPLGYVQLDLKRLIDYREYEGYRFGVGLETSKKLWKRAVLGGYVGYGTRDKAWKYGGYGKWIIIPKYFVEIQASLQQDLLERGGYDFLSHEQSFSTSSLYKHLYVRNMENQRKAEFAISGYITPRIKVLGSFNRQLIQVTNGYEYTRYDASGQAEDIINDHLGFYLSEASVEVVWSIREKLMYLGTKRVSLGSKWPKISAKATQGISGINNSKYDYTRLNVDIQQDVAVRGVGKFSYLLSAGKTIGDVPLFLSQVAPGTGKNWNVSVINSFETMTPSTFYNRQQASVFTRFYFIPFKTNKKWTTPQIVLHHAMGTGSFDQKSEHLVPGNPGGTFQSMDKGYYEGGVLIDKLLNIGYVGFGIGAFYNYGYYSAPKAEDNITLKIGISLNFN